MGPEGILSRASKLPCYFFYATQTLMFMLAFKGFVKFVCAVVFAEHALAHGQPNKLCEENEEKMLP